MKKLSLTCVALLLSACGGGGGDAALAPVPSPPAPVADAFYARMIGVVGNLPDDTEPGDVAAIVPNEPEDTEPAGF